MIYSEFENILNNLSLVTRVRFKKTGGEILFSVIRSFEGWILIDGTGNINFRFTEFDMDPSDRGIVNLRFWSGRSNENGYHIGAVHIKDIEEVDAI